jgi:hypothetical protein
MKTPTITNEKYVQMSTWVCVCGKRFRWPIESLNCSPTDVGSCLRCNLKDGDEVPIKKCRCKSGLDKSKEV